LKETGGFRVIPGLLAIIILCVLLVNVRPALAQAPIQYSQANESSTNGREGLYRPRDAPTPTIRFLNEAGPLPGPEIRIEGNYTEITDGDSSPSPDDDTDFGPVDVTAGPVTHTFTIKNYGDADLELTATPDKVTLGGDNAADFSVTLQPASPVATLGSTTFEVEFDPSAMGTRTATVTIENNDADEDPYTFAIQGTGTDVIAVTSKTPAASAVNAAKGSNIIV
jgi:hypothetical protein